MPRTFLAIMVLGADPDVGALREKHDPSTARGLGAHTTIRYPFLPLQKLDGATARKVEEACRSVLVFGFRRARLSSFASTAYLAPDPVSPS